MVFGIEDLPEKTRNAAYKDNEIRYDEHGNPVATVDEDGLELIPETDPRVQFKYESNLLALMHEISRVQYMNMP
jgi:hypothetical protein